jgi:hypothetical protein
MPAARQRSASSVHSFGKYRRKPSGELPRVSVRCRLTAIWQFAVLPSVPEALAGDPDRVFAFLRKSGVVDDPGYRVREGVLQAFRPVLPQGFPCPRALAEERLPTLLVAVRQPGRHRARAFAFAIQ